jgi:hypothetical protein
MPYCCAYIRDLVVMKVFVIKIRLIRKRRERESFAFRDELIERFER